MRVGPNIVPAEGMHVEWIDQEAVVLDEKGGHLHHLNPSAALVYALILEHGVEVAIHKLQTEHQLPAGAEADVDALIDDLTERGLLISG